MNNQWNRSLLDLSALLVTGALLATSVASTATAAEGGAGAQRVGMSEAWEIPTQLSNEPREDEPDGSCSRCTVDDLTLESDASGDTEATLELYFEDDGVDEVAEIYIRVLLDDGVYDSLTMPSVQLSDGQLHSIELIHDGEWSWQDVQYAWVEVR